MSWLADEVGHDARIAAINALHDAEAAGRPLSARVDAVAAVLATAGLRAVSSIEVADLLEQLSTCTDPQEQALLHTRAKQLATTLRGATSA